MVSRASAAGNNHLLDGVERRDHMNQMKKTTKISRFSGMQVCDSLLDSLNPERDLLLF